MVEATGNGGWASETGRGRQRNRRGRKRSRQGSVEETKETGAEDGEETKVSVG